MVRLWLLVNGIFFITVLIYSWNKESLSATIMTSKGIGQISLLFFLLNANMYFILYIIRKTKHRNVKKVLAKLSRKLMKAHIPIAITGTALVLVHATLMLSFHTLLLTNIKMVSGFIAVGVLVILLITGFRRYKKSTGFRRKSHIFMAFLFLLAIVIHIFS